MLLELNNVKKVYKTKKMQVQALQNINFQVEEGEFVAIMGESGSGKTTLLNIIASFDKPTMGDVILKDKTINDINDSDLASFRRKYLGFVFQDFNLLDTLTNRDNISLPLVLSNKKVDEIEKRVEKVASELAIEDVLDKYPYEISGGQKQRIAIARAIVSEPELVLADEPTGALDSKTAEQIIGVFNYLNKLGNSILMVTHSIKAASGANRVLFIKDGIVFHEIYKGDLTSRQFQEKIAESLSMLGEWGEGNDK